VASDAAVPSIEAPEGPVAPVQGVGVSSSSLQPVAEEEPEAIFGRPLLQGPS